MLIRFETAKLAKEKGFDLYVQRFYDYRGVLLYNRRSGKDTNNQDDHPHKSYRGTSAPTQSELQKWLRKTHNININILHVPHNQTYRYTITGAYQKGDNGLLIPHGFQKFNSFEEALEDGLLEALKLIE